MEGKYNIAQVAQWFLGKESMTQKRLQKLCYYAEAWFFALKEFDLVGNDFEAWQHGPVSSSLWNLLGSTGMKDIQHDQITVSEDLTPLDDQDDIELLEMVWNTYGELSANALEVLTHTEEPWIEARGNCGPRDKCQKVISSDTMARYYKSIYNLAESYDD